MSYISDGVGSVVSGLTGALTVLAIWAIVGILAALAGTGVLLFMLAVWAYPHVERLADAFAMWLAGF